MVYLYAKAFPLGDRLPRYGGGGAQRQKGCGGPQGRMRGDLPSLPGKWAATATRPSSVTFGDSFPRGGSLFCFVHPAQKLPFIFGE